ncbi:hypothetical protein WN55_09869 [Dufourea novaeangliae]|uniref:Uncharacterized protein n=1 Tax=Dufourea novaeangliae TaxID=178035 RepID=A0A154P8X3_DUFNO|nr:hypothetical protein WN55_09869 [Dufourea novaeangliae]
MKARQELAILMMMNRIGDKDLISLLSDKEDLEVSSLLDNSDRELQAADKSKDKYVEEVDPLDEEMLQFHGEKGSTSDSNELNLHLEIGDRWQSPGQYKLSIERLGTSQSEKRVRVRVCQSVSKLRLIFGSRARRCFVGKLSDNGLSAVQIGFRD